MTQMTVGWLLLAGGVLAFAGGVAVRVVVGRMGHGRVEDGELDYRILMPAFVLGCGLCLTAVFLLGYETLA